MKISRLLAFPALVFALVLPTFAVAQTDTDSQGGTVTGAGHPGSTAGARPNQRQFGMHKLLRGIRLTDPQQQQILQLVGRFRDAHQPGAPRDPEGLRALRASVENILTPDQRSQFESNISQMHADAQARRQNTGTGKWSPNGNPTGGPFTPDSSPPPPTGS